jgi:hypothetical protein
VRTRHWRLRRTAPGHYGGSLTDAEGPFTARVDGNRLHIRFRMSGGLDAEQWLTLQANGTEAHNVMHVRKFGLSIAALEERIWKVD